MGERKKETIQENNWKIKGKFSNSLRDMEYQDIVMAVMQG